MKSGKLRHRITVSRYTLTQDPLTGYETETWTDVLANEPAAWLAGPGREWLAAESLRSNVEGRFIIRWSPQAAGIKAADRVAWDGKVYEIVAPPLADETARRELTLMVRSAQE